MYGVAGRQQRTILGGSPQPAKPRLLNGTHFVDDIQSTLERQSDGFTLLNRRISMEYLLQHFRVGDEELASCYQALQDDLRPGRLDLQLKMCNYSFR